MWLGFGAVFLKLHPFKLATDGVTHIWAAGYCKVAGTVLCFVTPCYRVTEKKKNESQVSIPPPSETKLRIACIGQEVSRGL